MTGRGTDDADARRFGPWLATGLLGRGGQGEVWRARHEASGRVAAVKTVRVETHRHLVAVRNEIHALAALDHPGVVEVYEHGVEADVPWYAMEIVEGSSLLDLLGATDGLAPTAMPARAPKTMSERTQTGMRATATELAVASPAAVAETASELAAAIDTAAEQTHGRSRGPFELADGGLTRPPHPGAEVQGQQDTCGEVPAGTSDPEVAYPAPADGMLASGSRHLLGLLAELCAALAHVHAEGLVHRDVKPSNVIVTDDGRVVLLDFGLAHRATAGRRRERLTTERVRGGTARYMAPEQILGREVDARADLYAVGCMLFEVFCRRPPFAADTTTGLLMAHVRELPRPPSQLAGEAVIPDELDALVLDLLAKDPAARPGYADEVAAVLARHAGRAPETVAADRQRPYLYRPVWTGNEASLARLVDVVEAARREQRGAVALIEGESGSGKTRLVAELRRAVGDVPVLVGECAPGLHAGALAPWQPILAALVARASERGADWPVACRRELGLLAPFVPALARRPDVTARPATPTLRQQHVRGAICAALSTVLAAAASVRPLVCVLDDLQWTDELTREHLVGPFGGRRGGLVIVGTCRSEEIVPDGWLRCLSQRADTVHVTLERLSCDATAQLIASMLASEASLPVLLVETIHEHADGNPFDVACLLQEVLDAGIVVRRAGTWQLSVQRGELPAALQAVGLPVAAQAQLVLPMPVRAPLVLRLRRLSAAARAVLAQAAVLGRSVEPALLEACCDAVTAQSIDALTRHDDILRFTSSGRLRFVHDKVREATLAQLEASESAQLHLRAARALAAHVGGDVDAVDEAAARIATHLLAAGRAAESVTWALRGARHASAQCRWRDARALAGEALAALPADAHGRRLEALLEVANAQRRIQGGEPLCVVAREARTLARRAGDLLREAEALVHLSDGLTFAGELDDAMAQLERAGACLDAAEEVDERVRMTEIRRLHLLANTLRRLGHVERAAAALHEALRIAAALGARRIRGELLGSLASAQRTLGDETFEATLTQALQIHREVGNEHGEAIALVNLANARTMSGQLDEARALYEQARPMMERLGHRRGEAMCAMNLGVLAMRAGDDQEARRALVRALELTRTLGDARGEASTLCNLAVVQLALGEPDAAQRSCREALAVSAQEPRGQAMARMQLARVLAARDALDEARREVEAARRATEALDAVPFAAEIELLAARIARRRGALERADELLAAFSPDALGPRAALHACERGLLAVARGEPGARHLTRARELASEGPAPDRDVAAAIAELAAATETGEVATDASDPDPEPVGEDRKRGNHATDALT